MQNLSLFEGDRLSMRNTARIRELIAANTWPEKWDGTEPAGDALLDKMFRDGAIQPLLSIQPLEAAR